ncbi:MAG: ATP-binding protein [Endomicrobiales bacterium]
MGYLVVSGFLVFACSLSCALFILLVPPRNALKTIWSLMSFSTCLWGIGLFFAFNSTDQAFSLFWGRFLNTIAILIPLFFIHFVFLFIGEIEKRKKELYLYYSLITLFLAVIISFPDFFVKSVSTKFGFQYYPDPGVLYYLFPVLFAFLIVYGIQLLYKEFGRSSEIRKNQIKYLLIGMTIGFSGGATTFFMVFDINVFPFGASLVTFYVFTVSYAILKYRLLEINVAITRASIFIMVYLFSLGIPFLIGYQLRAIPAMWFIPVIIAMMLSFLGPLMYHFLRVKADSILLGEQQHYQKILLQASEEMVREHNLDRLMKLIIYLIKRAVRIEFAAAFLDAPEEGGYKLKAIRDGRIRYADEVFFPYEHPFIVYIRNQTQPFSFEEMPPEVCSAVKLNLPLQLIVPSFVDTKLPGFLVLGSKLNENMYTQDDINVLATLSNQFALAIENCLFVQDFKKSQERLFAAEKLASIGGMAEGIAHQIKNRLSQFSINSQVLELKLERFAGNNAEITDKYPQIKELFKDLSNISKSVKTNVDRTTEIIKGIMNYSNIGIKEQEYSTFALSEIISPSVELLKIKHKLSEFPIKIEIEGDNGQLKGIKSLLMESLYNLLDNAYEAIKEKSECLRLQNDIEHYSPEIIVRLKSAGDSKKIEIRDNGIGIKKENIQKIFAPFYSTKSTNKSGSGIGMYIVKRMIEEIHRGKIGFESEYNAGTVIYIELPAN